MNMYLLSSLWLHSVLHEALLGECLVFGAGSAVVGKREDAYSAARLEESRHFDIARVHQLHQVFHDDVHAVFMEVAVVTEAEEIQLQALALHHFHVGDVFDDNLAEVGLSGNRTEGCELGAVELHPIVVLLVLVLEGLEHLGSIVHPVLRLLAEGVQALVFSVFAVCHCY